MIYRYTFSYVHDNTFRNIYAFSSDSEYVISSDSEILSLDLDFTYLSLGSASLVSRICLASQHNVVHVDSYRTQHDPPPGVWLNIKQVQGRSSPDIHDQRF